MTTSANGNMTHQVNEKDFVIERIFKAPRKLVFDAFTKPEYVSRWWAPGDYTIPVCKIDLRTGGMWHYCMRSPEGEEHWVRAIYQEIVEPEKIVYTALFADADANPTEDIPEQLGTITLSELDASTTKLALRFAFQTAEALQWTVKVGMIEGCSITLQQLDELLPKLQ
ncbi:SRPBCC domain-containing protein [Paenibacillus koleovorans]|uniref:SRPBCC domain-containing protein n=1 Tax=Paenibacillus koleovorans TaxID=121608 RepID=UPI000FDB79B9|nr:SRPBCC domain-containing protein [Paenibacillus koleovorans]